MRISLNWLKDYIDIPVSAEELAHRLTLVGIGIESIERPGAEIQGVVVGQILDIKPHPDADKLVVCQTNTGGPEPLQIVCGAKNMKAGDKVPTATVGGSLPGGFAIGRRKMRGIESFGMMCSARELGMGDDHAGLLILDPSLPIGEPVVPLLGLDDTILEIEITPNRGDWAGLIGVAREIAALFQTKHRCPEAKLHESEPKAAARSSVTIDAPELCRRYIARVLTDAKIGPSPEWMKRRLIAAGQRPINNVVDITNYVLLETGHPLHAFDLTKLAENRIVVRQARDNETIETIDKQLRKLNTEMLVIADATTAVAIAGIMGGFQSEVDESTSEILLESAWFDPRSIRKTARTLGMQTEASQRFQRGADIEMAEYAAARAAQLLQELAGAKLLADPIDNYPNPLEIRTIDLRYERCNTVLGATIPAAEQRSALHRLCFEVKETGQESCRATVPTWRCDATGEIDLIEEIARIHGYGNIDATFPRIRPTETVFSPTERKTRALRHTLVGQGLNELVNMTFSSVAAVRKAGLPDAFSEMVTLANPLSENHATMRTSLLPGLLETASRNARHGAQGIAAFELGPVFKPKSPSELPLEFQRLGIIVAGAPAPKHWSQAAAQNDFYDLKGYVETVLEAFAVPYTLEHTDFGSFQPGQSVSILAADGKPLGCMGKLKKDLQSVYDLGFATFIAELDLDALLAQPATAPQFAAMPAFPPSLRDLAVLVDTAVPAGDIQSAAREVGGSNLRGARILDVYRGKQTPEGKKSVALSLVFQSEERTLTDQDTQKSVDRILRKLQTDYKAELR